MSRYLVGSLFLLCVALGACQEDDFPNSFTEEEVPGGDGLRYADFALPQTILDPANNPTTAAKIELGRLLFWDPVLSGTKDVSCATCHHPDFGYGDGVDLSIGIHGIGLGPMRRSLLANETFFAARNAPSVLNTAFNGMDEDGLYRPENGPMFWDLRAQSLEAQALLPPTALEEMRGDAYTAEDAIDSIFLRLQSIEEYQRLFSGAFGSPQSINAENLGKALGAFQRSLVSLNSEFDRYIAGETGAMSPQAIRGFERFLEAGCDNCHSGPMFSDFDAHVLGVPDNPKLTSSDAGLNGTYAFRTPSLRNIGLTAPYFHSGLAGDLEDVLRFYLLVRRPNNGGGPGGGLDINPNVNPNQLAPELRQLQLGPGDVDEIRAFLLALNDEDFDRDIPNRVPSGLSVGGNIGQ